MVGLGNPGRRYAETRHNVGARVVERVAERARIALDEERFDGRAGRGLVAGEETLLLLPDTFMNRSGAAVAAALRALAPLDPARELLVVLDDADLPLGRLRLRARGSSGGHRGLADIIEVLGEEGFARLRFGIGRPAAARDTADFVLDRFEPAEREMVDEAVERGAAAVACFVAEGVAQAMNRFNAPVG